MRSVTHLCLLGACGGIPFPPEGAVKALADRKQCGYGSWCKCDSANPTCHLTNVPCQCFGADPESTAAAGAALLNEGALPRMENPAVVSEQPSAVVAEPVSTATVLSEDAVSLEPTVAVADSASTATVSSLAPVTHRILDRVRLDSPLRSQIVAMEHSPKIGLALRNSVANRVQALYETQLQQSATLGDIAALTNSFNLVRTVPRVNLKSSVAVPTTAFQTMPAGFQTRLAGDLNALRSVVVQRGALFDDLNRLAWGTGTRAAMIPAISDGSLTRTARIRQMIAAINALAVANQQNQVLKDRIHGIADAFTALEEAEGQVIQA